MVSIYSLANEIFERYDSFNRSSPADKNKYHSDLSSGYVSVDLGDCGSLYDGDNGLIKLGRFLINLKKLLSDKGFDFQSCFIVVPGSLNCLPKKINIREYSIEQFSCPRLYVFLSDFKGFSVESDAPLAIEVEDGVFYQFVTRFVASINEYDNFFLISPSSKRHLYK